MKNLIFFVLFLSCSLLASGQDYLQKADSCFDKGDYECAKKNYNLFQIMDGSDMSAKIQNADECLKTLITADDNFKEKDYEKARDRYKTVLEKNPKDAYAKEQYEACMKALASPVETVVEALSPVKDTVSVPVQLTDTLLPAPVPVTSTSSTTPADSSFLPAPVIQSPPTKAVSSVSTSNSDYRKFVFGVDLGVGARKVKEWGTFLELGIHPTLNFSPYIGWDIVNIRFQGFIKGDFYDYGLFQAMTGLRAYTKPFAKDVKGYAALGVGYGYQPHFKASGLAYEIEIGLYITKTLSTGLVYNSQTIPDMYMLGSFYFIDSTTNNSMYIGWRIDYDF